MEGPNIPVSSPAIRVVHGTKNIHETSQTCHSIPSYTEHSAPHLSGRYSNCRFKYNSLEQTHATGFRVSEKPGLYNKFREVRTKPLPSDGIFGSTSRFQLNEILPAAPQSDENNPTMLFTTSKKPGYTDWRNCWAFSNQHALQYGWRHFISDTFRTV